MIGEQLEGGGGGSADYKRPSARIIVWSFSIGAIHSAIASIIYGPRKSQTSKRHDSRNDEMYTLFPSLCWPVFPTPSALLIQQTPPG